MSVVARKGEGGMRNPPVSRRMADYATLIRTVNSLGGALKARL